MSLQQQSNVLCFMFFMAFMDYGILNLKPTLTKLQLPRNNSIFVPQVLGTPQRPKPTFPYFHSFETHPS